MHRLVGVPVLLAAVDLVLAILLIVFIVRSGKNRDYTVPLNAVGSESNEELT